MNKNITIAENAYLWIYSSKNGDIKKFSNVTINQLVSPFNHKPTGQYNAVNDSGMDRLVMGIEHGVWYYSRRREYVIWSKTDNDNQIKQILIKTLTQRAKESVNESLSIIKREREVLETAVTSLFTNCIVTAGNYDEVKNAVDRYFYGL